MNVTIAVVVMLGILLYANTLDDDWSPPDKD